LEAHSLRLGDNEPAARNAYEASRLLALMGHGDEVAYWLTIALQFDPAYRRKAILEPDFAKIVARPEVRGLLQPGGRPAAGRR
jgi:hypothetical protein